ncbi:MAG: DNA replication and repair protein RecF [Ferruginibacter sp.]
MFVLEKISITQFKNYSQSKFNFTERIIGICGMNGMGKTNLLDAIYYLCFTKSYFTRADAMNVQFGADGFRLEALFRNEDDEDETQKLQKLVCIYRNPGKKELFLNDAAYEKFSAHIGRFPTVIIAPDDVGIILGGSEERRRFIDTVLSQMDPTYLQNLINYNKIIAQRNSALKKFAEHGKVDIHLLDTLDMQLIKPATEIYRSRKLFTEELIPIINKFYLQIADNDEMVKIEYTSQLNEFDMETLLHKSREKDLLLQRANSGVHKDDLSFDLNLHAFKNIASQGQRKSLLFAMKLAEFQLLAENKGFTPLLLLDDVFEKLDDHRMHNLLEYVCKENDGQVFITDTNRDRLHNVMKELSVKMQFIEV